MEKIVESFFNLYNDDFFEYFDRYKVLKIMQNKEYKKINQQICSVKEKVISLLEDKESVALNYEEGKAINKILKLQEELDGIEIKEAFKLGFKEALIYLESMDRLNI